MSSCEYDLVVRQQPQQARLCSTDKMDRRPIDPPPIVQFRSFISSDPSSEPKSFLDNTNYFMFASLVSPDEDITIQYLNDGKTRALNGPAVSNLWNLQDPENDDKDAGFFAFPDLSVRLEGHFRLKLTLFEMQDECVHHCKSIFTDQFCVYTPNKFPGMQVSTDLACSLADQGIKIRLRHDTRVRTKTAKRAAAPSKRARDSGSQSDGRKSKRAKTQDLDQSVSTPQNPWAMIDPALANPYATYPPPPPHMPFPPSQLHYPPPYDTQYPPLSEAHGYAHYPPPPLPDWDASTQHPSPTQPWYGHVPDTTATLESGGEEKQSGATKVDPTPRRVLRARSGTVVPAPHG